MISICLKCFNKLKQIIWELLFEEGLLFDYERGDKWIAYLMAWEDQGRSLRLSAFIFISSTY